MEGHSALDEATGIEVWEVQTHLNAETWLSSGLDPPNL